MLSSFIVKNNNNNINNNSGGEDDDDDDSGGQRRRSDCRRQQWSPHYLISIRTKWSSSHKEEQKLLMQFLANYKFGEMTPQ